MYYVLGIVLTKYNDNSIGKIQSTIKNIIRTNFPSYALLL